ncbi:type VI secretion system lysozyme-related protein [Pirellula staleyi DSM 6068]|uniref:Type VI secretion system lysozyme-related protein n=1 Tax=Pirellula staleyi (strain ATCC 27377 / DSM 6068 / ICPB 4128) TaxID=530564 RepID=D2QZM6_PIRSD|nr:type VI secretion system baseplate subunit TssE [Pirellula staleyi]ADB16509.1 type VI secretion system lysozyme-related protein [Pirellula staleyi DSM 6068]
MAELTTQERLQPSLLDRLTDEEPQQGQESRNRRVLSLQRLRESVLRDLAWLLNTTNLGDRTLEYEAPFVESSVLNYGVPDFAGLTSSSVDGGQLQRLVKQAIWNFEPRILRETLEVNISADGGRMDQNSLIFEISGELWAQPVPLELFLKTQVDLETGSISIADFVR